MSTIPPEHQPPPPAGPPPQQPPPPPGGYGIAPGTMGVARLPIPGNAEFALYVIVVIVVAIIWAASDTFGTGDFVTALVILTFGYFISRGIAKASRVLEQ
jgi:hypothetical protein